MIRKMFNRKIKVGSSNSAIATKDEKHSSVILPELIDFKELFRIENAEFDRFLHLYLVDSERFKAEVSLLYDLNNANSLYESFMIYLTNVIAKANLLVFVNNEDTSKTAFEKLNALFILVSKGEFEVDECHIELSSDARTTVESFAFLVGKFGYHMMNFSYDKNHLCLGIIKNNEWRILSKFNQKYRTRIYAFPFSYSNMNQVSKQHENNHLDQDTVQMIQNYMFEKFSHCELLTQSYHELPKAYLDIMNGFANVYLIDEVWFEYVSSGKKKENYINNLYALEEALGQPVITADEYGVDFDELFCKDFIPLATYDGHTSLGIRVVEGHPREVYLIDYEVQELFYAYESFDEFLRCCYFKHHTYSYAVDEITEELISVLNDFLLKNFDVKPSVTIDFVTENLNVSNSDFYIEEGKVYINIKYNQYQDCSGYREPLEKAVEKVLVVMPKANVVDELSKDELEMYELLHKKLIELPNIRSIRKYGVELVKDYIRNRALQV